MFFATRYTILPEQLQLLGNKNPGLNWICNKNKTKKEQDWPQGILKAEIQNIDVILSDINLPDIDGYEVARQLRSSKKLRWRRCRSLPSPLMP